MENKLVKTLLGALLHTLVTIGKFFLTPFNLWLNAAERLVEQKENGSIDLRQIKGFWPMLSYLKRFFLDFLLDALSLLAYPLGVLWAFIAFFMDVVDVSFVLALSGFIATVITVYFLPLFFSLYRDLCVLCLLPIRKFLDWAKKPAQYLEINKTENK